MSLKFHAILSSVRRSPDVLLCPALAVSHPFTHRTHAVLVPHLSLAPVSHSVAVWVTISVMRETDRERKRERERRGEQSGVITVYSYDYFVLLLVIVVICYCT